MRITLSPFHHVVISAQEPSVIKGQEKLRLGDTFLGRDFRGNVSFNKILTIMMVIIKESGTTLPIL